MLKISGGQYVRDDIIIFMLFKMSFSDAISINEDERIYAGGRFIRLGNKGGCIPHDYV